MISSNYKKGGFYKETPKQTSDQVTCRGLQKPNTRYIGLTWPMRTDYSPSGTKFHILDSRFDMLSEPW